MMDELKQKGKTPYKTPYIVVFDNITHSTIEYDSKKLCGAALNMRTNTIDTYLNKDKLYHNRYLLVRGELHDKKITIELSIHPELLIELEKIMKLVYNCNILRLTNAICKDYVFNYESKNR
jgi:hypothetical protein